MAETSFEAISQDLQMKILSRMSLKSLGRCICASNYLASIIGTKQFKDLYLHQSMTRPRMLFIDCTPKDNANEDDLLFYSVYQDEKPLLSSGQQESHIFLEPIYWISQPIRGLICIREKNILIYNPTTRKFWTLPEPKTCKEAYIADYFGYDEATDEFKVLCVMQKKSDVNVGNDDAKEYKVLTVGSVEEPWRPITSEHYHTPVSSQGLCKGGVLYYGATSNSNESLVISFNLSSEKFTAATKLPEEVNISYNWWNFVNYKGEIALVNNDDPELHTNGVLQLWVRKEINKKWEWKKTRVVIPRDRWISTVESNRFYFKGTIGTGELVFALQYLEEGQNGSLMVLYYDEVTQNLRKLKPEREFEAPLVRTFLDYVDSPQLM